DGVRIGFLAQEPRLDPDKDVRGNVEEGVAEIRGLLTRFDEINARLGEPLDPDEMEKVLEEQARVQDAIEAAGGWDLDRTVEIAMDALRCPPGEADVATLSGGEVRRVALCRLLLSRPDMLLLDEPTNHLDAESVAWLERYLKEYTGTVVAITHDRYFLDNAAGWILELDRGHGIPWEGNYSSWLDQKQQRLAQEEKADVARQRTLARELAWVQMSPRARQAQPKARLQAYDAPRAYVASFNFRGSDQQKRVAALSGGERNRLHLAKILKSGANLLLLDEPTNDLDVDTLRALEDGLLAFAGCAVIISHDRWFLDRI